MEIAIQSLAAYAIGALVIGGGTFAVVKVAALFNVTLESAVIRKKLQESELVQSIIRDAAAWAEEQAHKALKDGVRLPSAKKLGMAIDRVKQYVPDIDVNEAENLVEQELGRTR